MDGDAPSFRKQRRSTRRCSAGRRTSEDANVERARSLSEQRHAVKEYFPIAAVRRLLLFFYGKWDLRPDPIVVVMQATGGVMEKLQFLGAAVAFFAVGIGMTRYEIARNRANRPILNGGNAIQLYYCGYLSSFVLGTVCVIAAIVK
jgi:hypothetical protein